MYIDGTPRLYASQRIQWTFRTDLSTGARAVAAALDTTPSMYAECWRSADWIAGQVGLCVSTVQDKLRELELKGLVDIVRDYGLRTRRRLVLLWRDQPEPKPEPEPVEETMAHARFEPTDAPGVAPHAEAPRAENPRPTAPASSRKATPQEVDALLKRASRLGSPSRRWVSEAVERWGLDNVSRAVDRALDTGKRRFGWACEAARAWSERQRADEPEAVDERISKWDAQAEAIRRIFGPGGTCPYRPELIAPTFVNDSIDGTWEFWKDDDHAKYERRLEL